MVYAYLEVSIDFLNFQQRVSTVETSCHSLTAEVEGCTIVKPDGCWLRTTHVRQLDTIECKPL